MKRGTRRQLWLLGVVAALLTAAWWQLRSDQAAAPGTLLPFKPDQITHVTLQWGNTPAEHYAKRGEQWWRIDQATTTPADNRRLGELIRAAAAPVQSWQPIDNYDLGKIGLTSPQAKLELDGETLRFGSMTAIGHNVYVQVGERVGIVPLRYMPRAEKDIAMGE